MEIHKPISEISRNTFHFKVIKAIGNLNTKTIEIVLLIENKGDIDHILETSDIFIIDIEGNKPNRDFDKEINIYPELKQNVPTKVVYFFKYNNFENEPPRFIKMLNLKYLYKKLYEVGDRAQIDMRDIPILWK